jgi:hypothetical protein
VNPGSARYKHLRTFVYRKWRRERIVLAEEKRNGYMQEARAGIRSSRAEWGSDLLDSVTRDRGYTPALMFMLANVLAR